MGILERVRGKVRERIEESRRAREAERKLRLAEEKEQAKKYIEKAKKGGVNLIEEEAMALVRKKKKSGVIEKVQKAGEIADAFAKEFSGDIYQPKNRKSGKSKKGKSEKKKNVSRDIDEIGTEFSELFGFGGKKGRGRDPFDFFNML